MGPKKPLDAGFFFHDFDDDRGFGDSEFGIRDISYV